MIGPVQVVVRPRVRTVAALVIMAMLFALVPFAGTALAAPAAPSTPDLTAASDTGNSSTDNITSDTTPTFTGTSDAGATVDLYAGATNVGSTTASAGGGWTITSSVLADGTYSFTATQTTGAGTSAHSAGLSVTIDTTAPGAPGTPDLTSASDTGTSNTDNYTSDTTPTFTGTSEANASVFLYADTTQVGTVIADGSGNWTITSFALPVGTYAFTATQTDAAGNGPSPASSPLSVTIDTSVPAAPSKPDLTAASDSGVSSTDNITSDTTPTFQGTADAGSNVTLYAGAATIGTGTTDGSGNWSITSATLTAGTYTITATATNKAGTSAASAGLSVTIETSLAVAINQAPTQKDPTGVSPINFTVALTNPVTDFTTADLAVTGTAPGTKSLVLGGGGTSYTVAVYGMTGYGTVVLSMAAGMIHDYAGNANLPSTSGDNSVTYDPTAGPTVTINQASGQSDPTVSSPITFTVVFSAGVTGFGSDDVSITGTAPGTKSIGVSGTNGGTTYTVSVSGMTGSGTVIASVVADAALSVVGAHPSRASTSTDNTVTYLVPSKWVVTSSSYAPTPGATVTISAQLADANGTPVPVAGITVTWTKNLVSGTFSSATSTTNASGVATVGFTVAAVTGTVYTVTATGGNVAGTSGSITVVAQPAQITLSTSASVITWSKPVTLTIQFGTNGASRTFALQTSPDMVNWTTIPIAASLTTNSSGTATFTWTPARNFWYRAAFAGTADLSAANSNVVRVVVRQIALLRPTLGGKVKSIASGTSITFTTTVRPARPELPKAKVTFLFKLYQGGRLVYSGTRNVYIDSAGLAKWTWEFGTSGEWYVRAIANPTTANANSVWSQLEHYRVP
jgi:hypothetical protein